MERRSAHSTKNRCCTGSRETQWLSPGLWLFVLQEMCSHKCHWIPNTSPSRMLRSSNIPFGPVVKLDARALKSGGLMSIIPTWVLSSISATSFCQSGKLIKSSSRLSSTWISLELLDVSLTASGKKLIESSWRFLRTSTSFELLRSSGTISILKLDTPGSFELDHWTEFPFGQFRDKCPCSLQLEHFPAAINSAHSLSLKLDLAFSGGWGPGLKCEFTLEIWLFCLPNAAGSF